MAPGSKINRPKIEKLKNPRKFKRQMKAQRKRQFERQFGIKMADVQDKEIMPASHLLKRRTCPKANITLSGKKKRKILKQLRRSQKEKEEMEFEVLKPQPKQRKTKSDVEMKTTDIPPDTRQDSEQDVEMQE
ncbi:Hypp4821 [Branchiostoma lanceolatum]|uniref:Hypp4821 protein n=1 Tax=Branchiostoma lanceolatum TaxID=7740 RepID=A0A8K0ACE0_BRALA|nr:Hypp4821 [Branchiostoma lanceolatum]